MPRTLTEDPPILDTREILYAVQGLGKTPSERARIARLTERVRSDVARLAQIVARHHGVQVDTWDNIEANEAVFTGDNEEALEAIAEFEGAL